MSGLAELFKILMAEVQSRPGGAVRGRGRGRRATEEGGKKVEESLLITFLDLESFHFYDVLIFMTC